MKLRKELIESYFGECPECRKNDGYLNIGRGHWFVCHAHRTRWLAGANLFSCWREESETVWKRNYLRIASYREVEPLHEFEVLVDESDDE